MQYFTCLATVIQTGSYIYMYCMILPVTIRILLRITLSKAHISRGCTATESFKILYQAAQLLLPPRNFAPPPR